MVGNPTGKVKKTPLLCIQKVQDEKPHGDYRFIIKSAGLSLIQGAPQAQYSGYTEYPGQVPTRQIPMSQRPKLDPEIDRALNAKPKRWDIDRHTEKPIMNAQDVVRDLGLSKAAEIHLSNLIAREALSSPNRVILAKAVMATLLEQGLNPDIRQIINRRSQQLYQRLLQKSGFTEVYSPDDAQLYKAVTRNYTITGDMEIMTRLEKMLIAMDYLGRAGASRELRMYVDGDGADRISVKELADRKSKNIGKLTEGDYIQVDAMKLAKALFEDSGGHYHAKVKHDGKTKYYYDADKYHAAHGHHTYGGDDRKGYLSKKALEAIECAGGECDIKAFAGLVKRHGPKDVHAAVKGHCDSGAVSYKGGKFSVTKKGCK